MAIRTAPQVRAGNAMTRARAEILAAAADLVAEGGVGSLTMVGLARRSRVAKATVYNHFRDRDEVVAALVAAQGELLVAHSEAAGDRFGAAAEWLAASPVLAGVRRHDPDLLITLVAGALGSSVATTHVSRWCTGTGWSDPAVALRWLTSFAVAPTGSADSARHAPDRP